MLYRGARLTQAQEWRERSEAELNLIERDFLDASIAERQKQRQRQRLLVGAAVLFAVLFIVASGAVLFGFWQTSESARKISEANREAAIANEIAVRERMARLEAEKQTQEATTAKHQP